MSASISGIKSLIMCDGGTLATTPVDAIAVGLRNGASHKFGPYRSVKDYRNGEFPNLYQHTVEAETIQPTMQLMQKIFTKWMNLKGDVQLVTNPQDPSDGTTDDVIKFVGNNAIGIAGEFKYTDEKRSAIITMKRALSAAAHQALIDAMDSDTAVTVTGITGRGEDSSLFRPFNLLALEAPKATALLVDNADIDSMSLSIKSIGSEVKLQGYDLVSKVNVTLEINLLNASAAKIVEILGKGASPSVLVKFANSSTFYDAFDFAAGALVLKMDYDNNDSSRILKLTAQRDFDLWELAWSFGATFGGDAADTKGIKGGTLKFGY
ncbi:MAG TPA: hypothetical protein VHO03_17330 [Ignavibacteriales bacterium]|nr:hypothetical protein [Ignavibacteriales bacterium]